MAGRPSDYTQELADEICAEIAQGKSLRSICKADDKPNIVTIFRWLRIHEEFCNQYTRAREEQAESIADECLDIAEDEEDVQRARLKIETRKWFASKMKPKKYGERSQMEISGPDGGPVETVTRIELVAATHDDSADKDTA